MALNQIPLSRVSGLEESHVQLLNNAQSTLLKLRALRRMIRHLRVDMRQGNSDTAADWLAEFDTVAADAWGACRELFNQVEALQQERLVKDGQPVMLTAPMIDIARAARELIQADNACTIGRPGSEHRWDKSMDNLKRAVLQVRDQ